MKLLLFLILCLLQMLPWIGELMFAQEGELAWVWWVSAIICASAILLIVRWANRLGLSEVSFGMKGWRKRTILNLFLLGLVSYGTVFTIRWAIGGVQIIGMPQFSRIGMVIVGSLLMTLYIAFTEEVIFRGFVLSNLLRRYSVAKAIVGSLILFILFHLPKWESLVTSPYLFHLAASGVVLSIVYIKSKTLWHSIGLHWGWNMGAFALIEYKDTVVWTHQQSSFGWFDLAGWVSAFVNLILIYLVLKLYKTRHDTKPT